MATIDQVVDIVKQELFFDDSMLADIEFMKQHVAEHGNGLYNVCFSRGEFTLQKLSDSLNIRDITRDDPEYFEEFTGEELLDKGVAFAEEDMFFVID